MWNGKALQTFLAYYKCEWNLYFLTYIYIYIYNYCEDICTRKNYVIKALETLTHSLIKYLYFLNKINKVTIINIVFSAIFRQLFNDILQLCNFIHCSQYSPCTLADSKLFCLHVFRSLFKLSPCALIQCLVSNTVHVFFKILSKVKNVKI